MSTTSKASNGKSQTKLPNAWIWFICISGAAAVGLGAFGAHGLKESISPERLETFETGNFYHYIHTLALLACALYIMVSKNYKELKGVLFSFALGIGLFSISLYILSVRGIIGIETMTWIGAITPFGGLAFIAGWVLLAIKLVKLNKKDS